MTQVTAKMVADWRRLAGPVSVRDLAAQYGVNRSTIYFHINPKHAGTRREQWRKSQARRTDCRRHVTKQ